MRKPTKPIFTFNPISILRSTLLLLLLSMASIFFLSLFFFLNLHPHSSAVEINQVCNATRFPLQCHASLIPKLLTNPTPLQIIQSAIKDSSSNIVTARSMLHTIRDASRNNRTRTTNVKSCLQVLHYSRHRNYLAAVALRRGANKDARAWMSASVGYQYGCWNGLKYINHTALVAETMTFLDSLVTLSSNALSMLVSYDLFGNDTASWRPPMTERDGFWEPSGTRGLGAGPKIPENLKADAVVCKGTVGCFQTVREAVHAAPDHSEERFVIYIKEGVYEEKVRIPLRKRNVVFLGDGMGKTVITGSANVGQTGVTTYNSATVGVAGDGFMAKDLTIQNTAGADAHQAVAFRSDSDRSVIENCEFIGNQDTLYAHSLRQFYKSCRIQGNVDFIFGNSAAIFQDCEILVQPRQGRPEKGESNAVTAHGRTDPAQSTGFVFQNCTVNGTQEYMALYYSNPQVHINYLGRPWKEYSRTVFIHTILEALITPEGWMPWTGDFALKTLYYGEFDNSGPGSNLSKRVPWSNQIPSEHMLSYSVQSFIQGEDWNNRFSH